MGTPKNSEWRMAIAGPFYDHRDQWRCRVLLGAFYKAGSHYCRADVAVENIESPENEIPFAVFEVLDFGEQCEATMHRLAAFEAIGVPQIWVVACGNDSFARYRNGELTYDETRFNQGHIQFALTEIKKRWEDW